VIKTFRSKPLSELWSKGRTAKIDVTLHKRILIRLDRLNVATAPEQMNLPGFNFHALRGFVPTRYTVHVKVRGVSPSNSMPEMLCVSMSSN
jgi:toxin HigB-1